jgi:hypothetical protein
MHWGDTIARGSEHLIDGKPYSAEVLHTYIYTCLLFKNNTVKTSYLLIKLFTEDPYLISDISHVYFILFLKIEAPEFMKKNLGQLMGFFYRDAYQY